MALSTLPWYLTWPLAYEFLRVTTQRRVLSRPCSLGEAFSFVEALLASRGLHLLTPRPRHAEVAALTVQELPDLSGNLLHDTRAVVLMREHGMRRIGTRDTDFHRVPFLEVIDRLRV